MMCPWYLIQLLSVNFSSYQTAHTVLVMWLSSWIDKPEVRRSHLEDVHFLYLNLSHCGWSSSVWFINFIYRTQIEDYEDVGGLQLTEMGLKLVFGNDSPAGGVSKAAGSIFQPYSSGSSSSNVPLSKTPKAYKLPPALMQTMRDFPSERDIEEIQNK